MSLSLFLYSLLFNVLLTANGFDCPPNMDTILSNRLVMCHSMSLGLFNNNHHHHGLQLRIDLITRVILLSGSALSPWAIQKEPLVIKKTVAVQTGCHGDLLIDDLAPCLRNKSVKELLSVSVDSPR